MPSLRQHPKHLLCLFILEAYVGPCAVKLPQVVSDGPLLPDVRHCFLIDTSDNRAQLCLIDYLFAN